MPDQLCSYLHCQAPEREESVSPPAASCQLPPKYTCSLISQALDSEAETPTNRYMEEEDGGGGGGEREGGWSGGVSQT